MNLQATSASFQNPNNKCINPGLLIAGRSIAASIIFGLSLNFNFSSSNANEVKTYTAGVLRITGNRQHVCNVLLPRGPGIGGSFFYPEEKALWENLRCQDLYCNLSDVNCRTSLRSQWANPDRYSTSTKLSIVNQVIQFPNQPISGYESIEQTLTTKQINGLNGLFNTFQKVDNLLEPVKPGKATNYKEWNALCIGQEGQSGCPRSARHEILSYGRFNPNKIFWTSRGWVLYKPYK
jgi:hypothetical protein